MRIPYSVLIVMSLITAYLLNHESKMRQIQNVKKIQELQKTAIDLQLELFLLPKTLTPEQKAEIGREIVSKVGGSTDLLTPEQILEIVTEIVSRVGGSTEVLTPEQKVEIITEILFRIGGF